MSDATKAMYDFLTKSPSVVFPDEVLELFDPVEAENRKLRELVRKVEHYERAGCHECPYSKDCDAWTLYDESCVMSAEIEREKRELGIEVWS